MHVRISPKNWFVDTVNQNHKLPFTIREAFLLLGKRIERLIDIHAIHPEEPIND